MKARPPVARAMAAVKRPRTRALKLSLARYQRA